MMQADIIEDPDVTQAVEDYVEDVAEIRDLISRPSTTMRARRVGQLFADIHLRAERIRVEPHQLIRLISAELDRRTGRRGAPGATGGNLRARERDAKFREEAAAKTLEAAQQEFSDATLARVHAQSRCLAFGIEVRG